MRQTLVSFGPARVTRITVGATEVRVTSAPPSETQLQTIDRRTNLTLNVNQKNKTILQSAVTGPKGRDGVDGGAIALTALTPLNAHKVITTDDNGNAIYASSGQAGHIDRVAGVTENAGTDLRVRSTGIPENPGWNFTPRALLFLGLDGEITQSPSTGTFTKQIGYAQTPTRIFVRLGRGILRG